MSKVCGRAAPPSYNARRHTFYFRVLLVFEDSSTRACARTHPHTTTHTYTTNQVNFCEFQVLFLLMGVRVQLALVQSAGYTVLLGVGLYLAGVNLLSTAAASLAFMMIWGICIALVLDMQVVHSAYDMLRSLYIYNS
jgi:hypothetical protein